MRELASISEPESHAGTSLATRHALGNLPMTETLELQVENRGWQPQTHTKNSHVQNPQTVSARMEEHSGGGQGLKQVMVWVGGEEERKQKWRGRVKRRWGKL